VPTQAVFYRDEKGRQPVRAFLEAELTPKAREAVARQIREMNGIPDNDPPPAFPLTSQLSGRFRELRCHNGSDLYRVIYRRSGNLFVLLHAIRKDSKAVPRRDIELAQRRWRNFKQRMHPDNRRGPRPAGRDAP